MEDEVASSNLVYHPHVLVYIYILQSFKSGHFYVGSTENLERRFYEHNSGKTVSIRNKGPWKLIYTEQYQTRLEARRRELKIKSYKGGNGFKKLIKKT